jgi:putative NADH-flavin reductase
VFIDYYLIPFNMKIAVFGAGGNIGSRIVDEALRRGHFVTALVRNPVTYNPANKPDLKVARADIFDSQEVETGAFDHDVLVSAYSNTHGAPASTIYEVVVPLLNGVRQANVKRLIIVGGAGSLEVAPGVQLVDTPEFPEAYKAVALAHRQALKLYQNEAEVEWTYVSPAAEIAPGERTGTFRTGTNQLIADAQGKSFISMEDFAVAILDEIEQPKQAREQFTVGY